MNAALPLPALDDIRAHEAEMIEIRQHIHRNPETVEVNAEEGPVVATGRGVFNQS